MECKPGTIIVDGYEIIDQLGEGFYGKVCKAKKDGMEYAVKIQPITMTSLSEANIGTTLNHKFVVKYTNVKMHNNLIYMFSEAGKPSDLLVRPTMDEFKILFFQLLSGLAYFQQNHIIHCDIKPENLIFKNGDLRISDFGLVEFCPGKVRTSQRNVKSPFLTVPVQYRPPEIWYDREYNWKVDVYSAGCTLYTWVAQQFLFNTPPGDLTLEAWERTRLGWMDRIEANITDPLIKELIVQCIRDDRPSAIELLQQYAPQFFLPAQVVSLSGNIDADVVSYVRQYLYYQPEKEAWSIFLSRRLAIAQQIGTINTKGNLIIDLITFYAEPKVRNATVDQLKFIINLVLVKDNKLKFR